MNSGIRLQNRPLSRGFTLIELLVVIAIISILAAFLFPVFNSAREAGRRGNVASNMHEIYLGIQKYRLDEGHYPEVLFGYYYPGYNMQNGFEKAKSTGQAHTYFPGIYPLYMPHGTDPTVFTDPNNTAVDTSSTASVTAGGNELDGTGQLTAIASPTGTGIVDKNKFYQADAYDVSPMVTGHDTVNDTTFVRRYQTSWTNLDPTDFRQLRLPTASGDSYVTCTTYHVSKWGKVVVLFLDGHAARTFDTNKFLGPGPDVASVATSTTGAPSPAKFWTLRP